VIGAEIISESICRCHETRINNLIQERPLSKAPNFDSKKRKMVETAFEGHSYEEEVHEDNTLSAALSSP
jgi:hypothetical protein